MPQLRVDLLNAQYDLRQADFALIILIVGDDRVGCNEVVDLLHEWMDARYIRTQVFLRPSDEEQERPRFWRYWRALPPKGRIAIYLGAWALNALAERAKGQVDDSAFQRRIAHIQRLEQALIDDGSLLLKLWIHLPKKELRKRLKQASKNGKQSWRLEQADWALYDEYDKAMSMVSHFLRKTATGRAPWQIIEGTDARYRNMAVGNAVRAALTARLEERSSRCASPGEAVPEMVTTEAMGKGALSAVDLTVSIARDKYKKQRKLLQEQLSQLSRQARHQRLSSVLVFEGWDAAGKGGVIRRLTGAMAAQDYRVMAIAAPNAEDKARHFLWRFWRQLPRAGQMVIFDRSWYGRVLVERVEGFAREDEWRRAYTEINDFEEQLVEHGIVLLKFWLHIDPDEQLQRFQAREKTPYKKYKITEEDYRNREKWDDYTTAVNDMVAATSTEIAPWRLVPANDKRWARIEVLKTVGSNLKRGLKLASNPV